MTDKIVTHNSTSHELQLGRFRLDARNNFTSVTAQRDDAIPIHGVFKHLHETKTWKPRSSVGDNPG